MRAEIAHVLMTADAVGGVWTYALDLARVLAAHGTQVTIATMGPLPTGDQLAAVRGVPGIEVVTSTFQLEWADDPWEDVAAAGDWLLGLEARLAPDIVHLNGYAHGALPFRAPVVVVGHSCVLSWARAVPRALSAGMVERYRAHVSPGIRGADHVAAPSAAMLAELRRHYGPLGRTSVIPNGRAAGQFSPGRKEPFVFTAGRLWDPAKNVEAVAAVAARLPWPVAMAGDGGPAHLGVRMLGRLPQHELAAWLGRASIFALPARYEPFGLLPLEAALSGCALVLGDIASLREVWGDAADYVRPGDHEELTRTLRTLMASPSHLQERARRARERAMRYSVDRMGDAYLRLYQGIPSTRGVVAHGRHASAPGPGSAACGL
jgi:glycosyltransferase involved in cell wall biosynthesis